MASSSLWGALAANVASYGKDLTQDIRDIVSGVDDDHVAEKNEKATEVAGQDEDLDAYIEDLERSLIRKKQEAEAAFKKIEELEAQVMAQQVSVKAPVEEGALRELQTQLERVQSQLNQDKARHASEMHDAVASFDVKVAAATQEAHRWRVECERLRAVSKAPDGASNESPSSTAGSFDTHPEVSNAVATLSSVLHAADLIDDGPRKLSYYASLVSSRLVAAEVDAKAVQTALAAFLSAQGERVDPAFNLAECKVKLDQLGIARRSEQRRLAEFEQTTAQLQRDLAEARAQLQAVELRHANECQDKDASYRHLHDKLTQSQVNVDHLSSELEATTCELQELQAVVAGHRDADEMVERNMELERAAYALTDELAQVKAQLELERAQWVQHERANTSAVSEAQWFELKSTLALVEADRNVAQQDAERLQTDLANLHAVLTQFQASRLAEEAQWQAKEASWSSRCTAMEAEVAAARERHSSGEDLAVLMQSVAKKDQEIERLRDALERSAARFHGDTVDSVDKRLMVQMLLQLHESPNKNDVLEVMGRILGFTAEEKERMLAHPGRLKAIPLFGSIFGSDTAQPAPPGQVDVAGKTFSDAWADFLLRETK